MNKEKPGVVRRLLRLEDTPKHEIADVPPKPSGGFIQSAGGPKMSDAEFVTRFASAEQLAGLRRLVEEGRAARPAFSFWLCSKCGWRAKLGPDAKEPLACLACNGPRYKDGGWLRPMSKKEISQFETGQAAAFKRGVEGARKSAAEYTKAYNAGLVK